MTNERQAAHRTFAENFLGLPKELRELVYTEVFKDSAPVPLEDGAISPAGEALLALGGRLRNPDFEDEVLKAYYTYSTLVVNHQDYGCSAMSEDRPCSCTILWLSQSQHCRYIRNLIIDTQEAGISARTQLRTLAELEVATARTHYRRCWEQILELPRLEELTIKLQKTNNNQLAWADFTPVLRVLRESSPRLQISLKVSFDALLEAYWSDPIWENTTEPGNVVEYPYDPMGFVDVTEVIQEPTEEDLAYVNEHLPEEIRTPGRDILRGLLDETASQRRALALHYVVKEPALLRVRIKEHYEVYKKMRAEERSQSNIGASQC
jgi:hypothetical protein